MKPAHDPAQLDELRQFGLLDLAVLLLSVYTLGALLAQVFLPLPPAVRELLRGIDAVVCVVFLADFFARLRQAPVRVAFLRWGWIDLVSSIPTLEALRWGRVVRLVRIIRLFRAFRSARHVGAFVYGDRVRGVTFTAALGLGAMLIFSTITVLVVEQGPGGNIRTPLDALWWAAATITTVGYGDHFPVTTAGRLLGLALMAVGIALFGVISGLVARLFVEPEIRSEGVEIKGLVEEVEKLRGTVARLEAGLATRPGPPPPPAEEGGRAA